MISHVWRYLGVVLYCGSLTLLIAGLVIGTISERKRSLHFAVDLIYWGFLILIAGVTVCFIEVTHYLFGLYIASIV